MIENIELLETIEFLDGTEIEPYDEELAQLTLDNPENDWSEKNTNGIGDDE